MTDFKWRHYQGQIILKLREMDCKYGISYRDLGVLGAVEPKKHLTKSIGTHILRGIIQKSCI